jgi:hypothetical protein
MFQRTQTTCGERVCVVLTVGVGDEDDLLGVDLVHELDLVLEQRVVAVTLLGHINPRSVTQCPLDMQAVRPQA